MIVRRIPKPALQAMLRALRAANLQVTKLPNGYEVTTGECIPRTLLLKAMNGQHDYLVRMVPDLFEVSA
jgi:hypothetical protein